MKGASSGPEKLAGDGMRIGIVAIMAAMTARNPHGDGRCQSARSSAFTQAPVRQGGQGEYPAGSVYRRPEDGGLSRRMKLIGTVESQC